MQAIETKELCKCFGGTTAVDHLSLNVPQGSVFGFLGPNGAGKTTTIKMLVGLARPTGGDALVLGESILGSQRSYLGRIGFLPDVPGFYNWMQPHEYLRLVGEIFGIPGRQLPGRIAEVLELAGLKGVKTRIGGFSRGMKQRLGLAQALINRPELLFLDEPTSALDPIGRKDFLEAIARLGGETTVFFSTHILNDVERVCDVVAILNQGRLVTEQKMDSLRKSYAAHYIYLEVEGGDFGSLVSGNPWLGKVEPYADGWRIHPSDLDAARRNLPQLVGGSGLVLRRFELLEPSLEEIFIRLVNEP